MSCAESTVSETSKNISSLHYPNHNSPVFGLNHEIHAILVDCFIKRNTIATKSIVFEELKTKYDISHNFLRCALDINGYEEKELTHEEHKEILVEKDVFAKQRVLYFSMMSTARSIDHDLIYIDERMLDNYFLDPFNFNKMSENTWCDCFFCNPERLGRTETRNLALFAVSLKTGLIAASYITTKFHKNDDYFGNWIEKEIIPKLLGPSTVIYNKRNDFKSLKCEETAEEGTTQSKQEMKIDTAELKLKVRNHNVVLRLPTLVNYNIFELIWNDLRREMEEKNFDKNVTDPEELYFIATSYLKKFGTEDWKKLDLFMEEREKDRVQIDKKLDEVIEAVIDFTNDKKDDE